MSDLKTLTLEDQMKHVKKIEALLEKFKDKRVFVSKQNYCGRAERRTDG